MGALLSKEWREHRLVLLAILLLLAICQAVTLRSAGLMGSPMVAFQKVLVLMGPLMALVLANRLMVREYMGRTQLFLETLPVSRSQVLALKWLLGAALLWLALAACFGAAVLAARGKVVLTPHYLLLVALRSSAFLFFCYALAFMVGLTGRYRYLLWGLLIAGVISADTLGQLAASRWPPFYLVQEALVYEKHMLPVAAVLQTCAMTVALVLATLALALAAEGALVVALSRRMSAREKAAVTISGVVVLIGFALIDERKPKPPFVLQQAVRSSAGPAVMVGVAGRPEQSAQLADLVAGDLARLQDYLALADAPTLTVLPDEGLDGDAFQRAALPNADGVVVRAAFDSAGFDRDAFRAYALAAWLQWYGRTRAAHEARGWLLDGVAQSLVAQEPQQQARLALRAAYAAQLLQARYADPGSAVWQWLRVREELGPCLADALAWRMVSSLGEQMGQARVQALGRTVLATRLPDDVRALLFEPTFARQLAQAGAPDQAALARQFGQLFSAEQARLATPLAQIATPAVSVDARRMQGSAYEVRYQVSEGAGEAAGTAAPFSVLYLALGPWDGELAPELLARVDASRAGVLPVAYARGARLFTAVERRNAQLGCNVRLAARRWEVR